MLKVLQVRFCEQGGCRFKKTKLAKLNQSRRRLDQSRHEFVEF